MANTAFSPNCTRYFKNDKCFLITKTSKRFLILLNIFFLITVLTTSLFLSNTLYRFFHEYFFGYFHDFQNTEIFLNTLFSQTLIANFSNLKPYLNFYGRYQAFLISSLLLLFTETLFLLFDFFLNRYRWNKYHLSYGVYINKNFHKLHHQTYCLMTKAYLFIVNNIFLSFVSVICICAALARNHSFQNFFHLTVAGVVFLFLIFLGLFILTKYYESQKKYKANFDKYNWKHDNLVGFNVLKSFVLNLLLVFLMLFMAIFALPVDLFVIYLLFRYLPKIFT